jgi:hypothetical protein
MMVVKDVLPFSKARERIIVPRAVLSGLLTALHYKFVHPTHHQMKALFNRYFFALDFDKTGTAISSSCIHCSSLQKVPKYVRPQSSEEPPKRIGTSFAADIIKRYKQLILLLRETVSSYTVTMFIPSERHDDIREGLIILCSTLGLIDGNVQVRVDPAPGFASLTGDPILKKHGISLIIGNAKNQNKNPVAEHAIQELGIEYLNISPEGGALSKTNLALTTARLNSRIRHNGLSSNEIWTQRDHLSGEQLPLVDRELIHKQQAQRMQNHPHSAKCKAGGTEPYIQKYQNW